MVVDVIRFALSLLRGRRIPVAGRTVIDMDGIDPVVPNHADPDGRAGFRRRALRACPAGQRERPTVFHEMSLGDGLLVQEVVELEDRRVVDPLRIVAREEDAPLLTPVGIAPRLVPRQEGIRRGDEHPAEVGDPLGVSEDEVVLGREDPGVGDHPADLASEEDHVVRIGRGDPDGPDLPVADVHQDLVDDQLVQGRRELGRLGGDEVEWPLCAVGARDEPLARRQELRGPARLVLLLVEGPDPRDVLRERVIMDLGAAPFLGLVCGLAIAGVRLVQQGDRPPDPRPPVFSEECGTLHARRSRWPWTVVRYLREPEADFTFFFRTFFFRDWLSIPDAEPDTTSKSDLCPQLFSDVNCIALWTSSEKILTRLYSVLH